MSDGVELQTGNHGGVPLPDPVPGRIGVARQPVAIATFVLIGINILVFVADLLLRNAVTDFGALVPLLVVEYRQWWRLIAAGFLHADFMHIALNLYAFYGLGRLAERFFGTGQLIAVYGLSLFGASTLVTLFSPLVTPTVGASGAIMGVLGALVIFFRTYREQLVGGRGFLNGLIRMALINIGIGLLPGISWWGHLGGFAFGALTGLVVIPRATQRCVPLPSGEVRCYLVRDNPEPHDADSRRRRLYLALIVLGELGLLSLAFGVRG
jgi:membrane associated rhomboid family serine protease